MRNIMRQSIGTAGKFPRVLGYLLLTLSVFAMTACSVAPLKRSVPPAARDITGGREVQVSVIQREISTQITQSKVAAATGGGLLMALIDAGVNQSRAKGAESTIGDLRTQLADYDFDAATVALTKGVITQVPWAGNTAPAFSKERSDATMLAALDKAATSEVTFFDYYYGLNPQFSELEVIAAVDIGSKAPPAGTTAAQRTMFKNLVYTRRFVIVTPLSAPSKEKSENVARWSHDKAALARRSIDAALVRLQALIVKGLLVTPEDEARTNAMKGTTQVGTRIGKVIDKSDAGTLLQAADGPWVFVTPEIT
jgi:hypothetical protein